MNILKDYRFIVDYEDENKIILIVPQNYNFLYVEEIRFLTGKAVILKKLPDDEFTKLLQERISQEDIIVESGAEEGQTTSIDILASEEDSPIINLVNSILIKANTLNASDIHFEPYEDSAVVRFRMDGVLHEYLKIPFQTYNSVVSRIKVISNLNIAEKRVPQDGRIGIKIGSKDVDVRVSIIPTVFGERVVLRLLDKSGFNLTLQDLGFSSESLNTFKKVLKKPYGIVLVTGPTGAGKSTTLYASLQFIKDPRKNIITIEDPVEYQIKGISQIQVNPKVGLTFASGLRSILRQDPDIIMVGEIRDSETADIAIHAALTGHLVLSTLHTNDAVSSLPRLIDMGMEPFLVANSLEGVLAQRLVRKICIHCKTAYKPSAIEIEELKLDPSKDYTFYKGVGCQNCLGSGYKGRVGIFEVFDVDQTVKSMIAKNMDTNEILTYLKSKGFKTMFEDGVDKVLKGITTPSEVLAVIK
ncbi:MAG: GspE/PulE family protein [Hydrogenothermaceae bacterium]|nr:GspE/PulE family protein [Hydrogenothermaceae bacterium]